MGVPLTLSDLIQNVRAELLKLRDDPEARKDPVMVLNGLDLELEIEVSTTAKGGLQFYILEVGGEAHGKHTHRIKLSFEPFKTLPKPETPTSTAAKYLLDATMKPLGGKLPIQCPSGVPKGVIVFKEFPVIRGLEKFTGEIEDMDGRSWSIDCTPKG